MLHLCRIVARAPRWTKGPLNLSSQLEVLSPVIPKAPIWHSINVVNGEIWPSWDSLLTTPHKLPDAPTDTINCCWLYSIGIPSDQCLSQQEYNVLLCMYFLIPGYCQGQIPVFCRCTGFMFVIAVLDSCPIFGYNPVLKLGICFQFFMRFARSECISFVRLLPVIMLVGRCNFSHYSSNLQDWCLSLWVFLISKAWSCWCYVFGYILGAVFICNINGPDFITSGVPIPQYEYCLKQCCYSIGYSLCLLARYIPLVHCFHRCPHWLLQALPNDLYPAFRTRICIYAAYSQNQWGLMAESLLSILHSTSYSIQWKYTRDEQFWLE